jgi:hypothetical protein
MYWVAVATAAFLSARPQNLTFRPPPESTTQAAAAAPESSESPRAVIREFLQLADRDDYAGAAQYLALDPRDAPRRAELARRVHDVIRRRWPGSGSAVSSWRSRRRRPSRTCSGR